MLTPQDNERLTRVGPDTPMGRVLRRSWLPFAVAEQVSAGGDPQRIELCGEHFVAWRDAAGRPGLFAEACLHRGASMLLARDEGDGLRCIYHGWKFAVDGTVLDTPNVADARFRQRLRGRSFAVREAGGLLWTCLATADDVPPFPSWPWLALPAAQRLVTRHVVECSFVQVLEGLVDSSHLGLLHMNGLAAAGGTADLGYAQKIASMQRNLAPRQDLLDTDFGFFYAALREMPGGNEPGHGPVAHTEVRVAAFVAPCTVLNPNGDIATIVVPMGDARCAFFHVFWSEVERIGEEPLRSRQLAFVGLAPQKLQAYGLVDGFAEAAARPSPTNRWLQDRAAMRAGESFSGLPGIIEEDAMVSIASGPVRDRAAQVLSASDVGVARLARCLLQGADAVEQGRPVPGQHAGIDWPSVVGLHGALPAEGWRALLPAPYRPPGAVGGAGDTGAALAMVEPR